MMPVEPPAPPTPEAITGLPSVHTLTAQTIAAGDEVTIVNVKGRMSVIACPTAAGDAGCVISTNSAGAWVATGSPTVTTTTHPLIFQANAGGSALAIGTRLDSTTPNDISANLATYAPSGTTGSVQSTLSTQPTVTPSAEWESGASPDLGLVLDTTLFSQLPPSALGKDPGKLSVASGSATPASLGSGWNGVTLSKDTANARTLLAIVYSDITANEDFEPDTLAQTVVQGLDLSGESAVSAAVASGSTIPAAGVKVGIMSDIGSNVMLTIPQATLTTFRSGALQTTAIAGLTVTYTDARGNPQTRTDATLTCATVSGCRAVRGSLQGTWDVALPKVDGDPGTPDSIYATLGSWLVLPDDSSNTDGINLGVFLHRTADTPVATETSLDGWHTGDITYTGSATGLYTRGLYAGEGTRRALGNPVVGSFVADVELTAAYGANTAADSFTGVSGTVTDFEENGAPLTSWTMVLNNVGVGSGGTGDTDSHFVGTTLLETGEGHSARGQWGVRFYQHGPSGLATDGRHIRYAGGTFNASTDAADNTLHVVGAFSTEQASN